MLPYRISGFKEVEIYDNILPAHFVPLEMRWKRRGSSRRV